MPADGTYLWDVLQSHVYLAGVLSSVFLSAVRLYPPHPTPFQIG